jgi:hypothetical protein
MFNAFFSNTRASYTSALMVGLLPTSSPFLALPFTAQLMGLFKLLFSILSSGSIYQIVRNLFRSLELDLQKVTLVYILCQSWCNAFGISRSIIKWVSMANFVMLAYVCCA